eukprot:TRINITY_DN1392_c1_g1_i1.p1 TRINITY_DN1392_c1_g1~~TRINITY_DN1392_c1_g1_i1.p1  ORF type:complete len:689 (-),score=104.65 TRINITY_DN1392_c1_g1_i1:93-2159(-)
MKPHMGYIFIAAVILAVDVVFLYQVALHFAFAWSSSATTSTSPLLFSPLRLHTSPNEDESRIASSLLQGLALRDDVGTVYRRYHAHNTTHADKIATPLSAPDARSTPPQFHVMFGISSIPRKANYLTQTLEALSEQIEATDTFLSQSPSSVGVVVMNHRPSLHAEFDGLRHRYTERHSRFERDQDEVFPDKMEWTPPLRRHTNNFDYHHHHGGRRQWDARGDDRAPNNRSGAASSPYIFLENLEPLRDPFDWLPDPDDWNNQGDRPGAKVRRQTLDYIRLITHPQVLGQSEYFVFMEDDFPPCPHALRALHYVIDKANFVMDDWIGLRLSFGMNGVVVRNRDLQSLASFFYHNIVLKPVDLLYVEWSSQWYEHWKGQTFNTDLSGVLAANLTTADAVSVALARRYNATRGDNNTDEFLNRNVAYRWNLFKHIGFNSSLRDTGVSSDHKTPQCWQPYGFLLWAVDRYDVVQCPDDDVSPCTHRYLVHGFNCSTARNGWREEMCHSDEAEDIADLTIEEEKADSNFGGLRGSTCWDILLMHQLSEVLSASGHPFQHFFMGSDASKRKTKNRLPYHVWYTHRRRSHLGNVEGPDLPWEDSDTLGWVESALESIWLIVSVFFLAFIVMFSLGVYCGLKYIEPPQRRPRSPLPPLPVEQGVASSTSSPALLSSPASSGSAPSFRFVATRTPPT